MDPDVQNRIAQLAELGTQSPLHAVRATEQIQRLMRQAPAAPPSPSTAVSRLAYPNYEDTAVAQHMDILPQHYGAKAARIKAPPEAAIQSTPVPAPTQYPPVLDARNHPPSYAQTIQPLMAPTLYLTVSDIPLLNPGEESPGERLDFSLGDGILIGMRGTAWSPSFQSLDNIPNGTSKTIDAITGVKLTINGQEQLIVDGESESWAWFSDLFGGDAVQWTPIQRHVLSSDILQVRFLNRWPEGEGPQVQPSLMFAYRRLPMPV
jgi:hypothetical protein